MYGNHRRPDILLKTAIAEGKSDNHSTFANILFDEGAQRSFITQKLADNLKIRRKRTDTIRLAVLWQKEQVLCYQHLDRGEIFLITDIVEDIVIRGNGPTAVKSKVGYLLSGPINGKQASQTNDDVTNVITSRESEENSLEKFWKLESMGITAVTDHKSSDHAHEYQSKSVSFDGERYVAELPWKEDHLTLPTNYSIAKRRTESTMSRLRENPYIFKMYGGILHDQEKRGFIEKIYDTSYPDEPKQRTIHYIPHHPVKKDSTTILVRIVYDCSCKQSRTSPSLNECLQSTPSVLNGLKELFVRFRLNPIAVSTDIEKAFLHVGLHETDRDTTRFFWLTDPTNPDSELCTYRFKVVLFGATCSPFILNATLLKHLDSSENSETAEIIKKDLYVDNVISSFQSESEATNFYTESRKLKLRAGFNLRSWTSNSKTLREIALKDNVLDTDEVAKVLGMKWKVKEDSMTYATQTIPHMTNVTKRLIWKHSSRIYDPLGFLSPITVRAKILLQLLCREKFEWDTSLPETIQSKWTKLTIDINDTIKVTFPRRYFNITGDKMDKLNNDLALHVFVDSNKLAYGAVCSLCSEK